MEGEEVVVLLCGVLEDIVDLGGDVALIDKNAEDGISRWELTIAHKAPLGHVAGLTMNPLHSGRLFISRAAVDLDHESKSGVRSS